MKGLEWHWEDVDDFKRWYFCLRDPAGMLRISQNKILLRTWLSVDQNAPPLCICKLSTGRLLGIGASCCLLETFFDT